MIPVRRPNGTFLGAIDIAVPSHPVVSFRVVRPLRVDWPKPEPPKPIEMPILTMRAQRWIDGTLDQACFVISDREADLRFVRGFYPTGATEFTPFGIRCLLEDARRRFVALLALLRLPDDSTVH